MQPGVTLVCPGRRGSSDIFFKKHRTPLALRETFLHSITQWISEEPILKTSSKWHGSKALHTSQATIGWRLMVRGMLSHQWLKFLHQTLHNDKWRTRHSDITEFDSTPGWTNTHNTSPRRHKQELSEPEIHPSADKSDPSASDKSTRQDIRKEPIFESNEHSANHRSHHLPGRPDKSVMDRISHALPESCADLRKCQGSSLTCHSCRDAHPRPHPPFHASINPSHPPNRELVSL
jgi:hypothetical protein